MTQSRHPASLEYSEMRPSSSEGMVTVTPLKRAGNPPPRPEVHHCYILMGLI